ncbi:MAG: hypothetical protein AB1767_06645 [Bacillota bacterium]
MKRLSSKTRSILVAVLVLGMFLLHNSFWLWKWDNRLPILFGFMPFSFAYYAAYALLATAVLALIVALVWPDPPEQAIILINAEEGKEQ